MKSTQKGGLTDEQKSDLLKRLQSFNPDFTALRNKLNEVNFLRILGLEGIETRHSNMLAWLLDHKANHGLGNKFAVAFFNNILLNNVKVEIEKQIESQNGVADFDVLKNNGFNFKIDREHYFVDHSGKMRYIDLLLVSQNKQFPIIICIENKVFSLQHDKQLDAYYNYVFNIPEYENYQKVFLYLTPTEEKLNDSRWIKISYEAVLKALEEILGYLTVESEVKTFITHYYNVIRRDIMKQDTELIKICMDLYQQYRQELDAIMTYSASMRDKLSNCILKYLQDNSERFDIKLHSDKTTNWIKFTPNRLSCYDGKGKKRNNNTNFVCFDIQNYQGAIKCNLYLFETKPDYEREKKELIERAYNAGLCKNDKNVAEKQLCIDTIISEELVKRYNDAYGLDPDLEQEICKKIDDYMDDQVKEYTDILLGLRPKKKAR